MPLFQDIKLKPKTVGIGLITLLMAGLTVSIFCLNLVEPNGLAPIETTAQYPMTAPSNAQRPEKCQPDQVFRASDRRCYQLQGE
ncbi:MAG: hypothetical protein LH631_09025 [Alkalinema sp. CAN_BIN05]|nr:hypothetical protein [Alkalinema sp. CAN_BIN05]